MKKTIAAPVGVSPRLAAERFCKSTWLAAAVFCLAFSCGLTLISAVFGEKMEVQILGIISVVFNMLHVFAASAAMFLLWQVRTSSAAGRFKKAGLGFFALGLVLIATAAFLALLYFSAYSIFGSLTPETMAETELTQEHVDQMWAMLPYLILSLVCTAMEGVAFLVFRQALMRLGEMAVGKRVSGGIFTGCSVTAALTGGFILLRLYLDLTLSEGLIRTVYILLDSLAEAGVFAGIAALGQDMASALRGE